MEYQSKSFWGVSGGPDFRNVLPEEHGRFRASASRMACWALVILDWRYSSNFLPRKPQRAPLAQQ
eukprot:762892-Amphidinium_carterae.1